MTLGLAWTGNSVLSQPYRKGSTKSKLNQVAFYLSYPDSANIFSNLRHYLVKDLAEAV